MVADLDKVGTRGRHVELYRAQVVPLHGKQASVHIVQRHLAVEITLHHYLPVALIYHDVRRVHIANTLLGDIDCVVDIEGIRDVKCIGDDCRVVHIFNHGVVHDCRVVDKHRVRGHENGYQCAVSSEGKGIAGQQGVVVPSVEPVARRGRSRDGHLGAVGVGAAARHRAQRAVVGQYSEGVRVDFKVSRQRGVALHGDGAAGIAVAVAPMAEVVARGRCGGKVACAHVVDCTAAAHRALRRVGRMHGHRVAVGLEGGGVGTAMGDHHRMRVLRAVVAPALEVVAVVGRGHEGHAVAVVDRIVADDRGRAACGIVGLGGDGVGGQLEVGHNGRVARQFHGARIARSPVAPACKPVTAAWHCRDRDRRIVAALQRTHVHRAESVVVRDKAVIEINVWDSLYARGIFAPICGVLINTDRATGDIDGAVVGILKNTPTII